MPKPQASRLIARPLVVTGVACALVIGSSAQAQPTGQRKPAAASSSAQAGATADLARRLDELARQNAALQAKVDRLEAAQVKQSADVAQQAAQVRQQATTQQAQAERVEQQAQAVEKVQESVASSSVQAPSSDASATTVGAYGEIGYSRPTKSAQDTNVDVQRAVIGLSHRFDERTKMVGEFEWEHAVTSADDRGEAEVEQLWLEREFQGGLRARAGLFLMPVGLVNPNHEPTAYYGVYRPDVDTKIVPSTWREIGVGLSGDTPQGLTWDIAMTTMPNLSAWDASSTEGRERGPLQSIHGEGQFAAARDLGAVGALNWRGVPGLLLGGSMVYGGVAQHQPGLAGNGSRLLMLDLHGRYQVAGWDFAGEYVRGTFSHTEALNSGYAASAVADPTLVPHLFYGGYLQAAYQLWRAGDYTLSPFVRYEVLNTAAGFGGLSAAQGGVKRPDEKILTVGASLRIGEGVVLKADYRSYRNHKLPDTTDHFTLGNSFNLGAGFSF